MKQLQYKNNGLIFNLEIAQESGPIFDAARRHVFADLNKINSLGKLTEFHDSLEAAPLEYECAPCGVTLSNGGYSE